MFSAKCIILAALITSGFITFVRSIAFGRRAAPGEVPWQVQLRYKPSSFGNATSFLCGGTLVVSPHGNQVIITSRKCVTKSRSSKETYKPNQLFVYGGRISLDQENSYEQMQPVTRIEVHPDWRYLYGLVMIHDIALLHMKSQFNIDRLVYPLEMPSYTDVHPDPGYVIISGWGHTGAHLNAYADRLQISTLEIVDWAACNDVYQWIYTSSSTPIPKACFCAGKLRNPYYQGGCLGDQGGPGVSVQNDTLYLAGILSWSQPKCGNRYQPTVFTTVSFYLRWVFVAAKP